jgi:hypothetical protein
MKKYYLTISAILVLLVGGGIGAAMVNSAWERNENLDDLQIKLIELGKLYDFKAAELNRLHGQNRISQTQYDIEYDKIITGAEKVAKDTEDSFVVRKSAHRELLCGLAITIISLVLSIILGAQAYRAKGNPEK